MDVGIAPLEALMLLLLPTTTHSWCWSHTGLHGLPTVSPDRLLRVLEAMHMLLLLMLIWVIQLTVGVEESVAQFLLELAEHYKKEKFGKKKKKIYRVYYYTQ